MRAQVLIATTAALLASCSNDLGGTRVGPRDNLDSICDTSSAPSSCGATCAGDAECGAGTFCLNAVCNAFCSSAGTECGEDSYCDPRGRCVREISDGGVPIDGACVDIRVPAERVIPNIVLIVDRSGSMRGDFTGKYPEVAGFEPPTRWDAARNALIGPDGLVRNLESIARFSFAAYDKPGGQSCPPRLASVPLALNNANAIAATYNPLETQGGWTPTAEALDVVTSNLMSSPPPDGPTAYVLATDGFPNGCNEVIDEQIDRDNTVAAVARAFNSPNAIKTYVLGVSFEAPHLGDLANAGLGLPPGSGAQWWSAYNVDQLEGALREIVDLQLPCTIELENDIQTVRACEGSVIFNGEPLACDDPSNGWRAVDSSTIELLGTACDQWRSGLSELEAAFPCGVLLQ